MLFTALVFSLQGRVWVVASCFCESPMTFGPLGQMATTMRGGGVRMISTACPFGQYLVKDPLLELCQFCQRPVRFETRRVDFHHKVGSWCVAVLNTGMSYDVIVTVDVGDVDVMCSTNQRRAQPMRHIHANAGSRRFTAPQTPLVAATIVGEHNQ
jgi:hypothetical protein